jgi:hypothetical protein
LHNDLGALEAHLKFRLTLPLPGAQAQWKFAPHPSRKNWRPDDRPATAARPRRSSCCIRDQKDRRSC